MVLRPLNELGTTVKGDRSAGMPGQGRQCLGDLRHDRLGALFGVLQRDQEATCALDHGGDIGRPILLPEQHQVSLPVTELLAMRDDVRAEQGAEFRRKSRWRALANPVAPTAPAARGQVAPQFTSTTVLGIDVLIDRLLADPARGTQRWSGFFDQFAASLSSGMGFMSGSGFQVLVGGIIGLSGRQQSMR